MKKNPEYIILTPTYPAKLYCFNRFMKNIMSFRPKPKEVVFCVEPEMVPKVSKWEKELKKQKIKLVIFTLGPKTLSKFPAMDIGKLTYSREHLRKYFVSSQYEWALWLDSDIIPDSDVAEVLLKIANSEKSLVVANQYRTRIGNRIIAGMGCTLTHKIACKFSKFQITSLTGDERNKQRLADDFWFFSMLSNGSFRIKEWTGWNSQKRTGRFVSIRHIPIKGQVRFLKKDTSKANIKKDSRKTTKTFVILGMHRSATSLIAGALKDFGVDLGRQLLGVNYFFKDDDSKISAHFENIDFLKLNEEILTTAGGSWSNPPSEKNILALKEKFAPRIKKLVKEKSGLWGWKDPRTTLTIKLYLPYLKNPHFICCFREPLEVARSLYRRQKMPVKEGLKLAETYNKRLLDFLNSSYATKNSYIVKK